MVTAPVIHHIVLAAILGRNAAAFVPVVVRPTATTTVVMPVHTPVIMLLSARIMATMIIMTPTMAHILLPMAFAMSRWGTWLRLYRKAAQAKASSH